MLRQLRTSDGFEAHGYLGAPWRRDHKQTYAIPAFNNDREPIGAYQTSIRFCSGIPESIQHHYDNGGFSWRCPRLMATICSEHQHEEGEPEDLFFLATLPPTARSWPTLPSPPALPWKRSSIPIPWAATKAGPT
jgi:hypothetical protein